MAPTPTSDKRDVVVSCLQDRHTSADAILNALHQAGWAIVLRGTVETAVVAGVEVAGRVRDANQAERRRLERDLDEARAEVERLRAGLTESAESNARNRAEARRLRQEVERLREEVRLMDEREIKYVKSLALLREAVAHHASTLDDRALAHHVERDRDDIDNKLYNAVRATDPEWWDYRVPGLNGGRSS